MRMKKILLRIISHAATLFIGFAVGIYILPILTEADAPSLMELESLAKGSQYQGQFRRDLADSDFLHWGEGDVAVGRRSVSLIGRLAPGPDYKLYLSPEFVETERDFYRVKPRSMRLGDVRRFTNFVVPVPESVDVSKYNTVIIWCETFSQFITAAKYR